MSTFPHDESEEEARLYRERLRELVDLLGPLLRAKGWAPAELAHDYINLTATERRAHHAKLFATVLGEILHQFGWTVAHLASALQIPYPTVYSWLAAENPKLPQAHHLELLQHYIAQRDPIRAHDLAVAAGVARDPLPDLRPYPGPRPFYETDHARFYGREADVTTLQRLVEAHPLVLFSGPSGSGKTSVVLGGLLPALRQDTRNPWSAVTLPTSPHPVAAFSETFSPDGRPLAAGIAAWLNAHPPAQRLLLILDNFEAFFTQVAAAEQAAFLTTLQAVHTAPVCTVLLIMQSDAYPHLIQSSLWPLVERPRWEITPLSREVLRLIVERPAAQHQVRLEPQLVERLLADMDAAPGRLSLVQPILRQLWERQERNTLTLAAYEHLAPTTPTGIIAPLVTLTLDDLPTDQQLVARRILLRLVQFSEDQRDVPRRQTYTHLQTAAANAEQLQQTLHMLASRRLIVLSGQPDPPEGFVDLAHPALLTQWPVLREWVAEWRMAELARRDWERRAAAWARADQPDALLLDATACLAAEQWCQSTAASDVGVSATLQAWVRASRQALTRAQAADAVARQHARIQARALVTTRGWLVRLGGAVLGLLGLLLVASLLMTDALVRSDHQAHLGQAQNLAAQAQMLQKVDAELSLLVAMEAVSATRRVNLPPLPVAEQTLHQVADQIPLQHAWRAHPTAIVAAAYRLDGALLLTGDTAGQVRAWDTRTWQRQRVLQEQGPALLGIAWSPDQQAVLLANVSGWVVVRDAQTGQERLRLPTAIPYLSTAGYSPDGRWIVTASRTVGVQVWDATTARLEHTVPVEATALAIHPDGQRVFISGPDGTGEWDLPTATLHWALNPPLRAARAIAYSPDGGELLAVEETGSVTLWNARTGELRRVIHPAGVRLQQAAYRPDGEAVVTIDNTGVLQEWEARTGQERRAYPLRQNLRAVAYSPDGHTITVGSDDGHVYIWSTRADAEGPLLQSLDTRIRAAAYSSDGRWMLTTSDAQVVQLWDTQTGAQLLRLEDSQDPLQQAIFSPAGDAIITAGWAGTIRRWETRTGRALGQLGRVPGGVAQLVSSPDRQHLLVVPLLDAAMVWDSHSGQQQFALAARDPGSGSGPGRGPTVGPLSSAGPQAIWRAATGEGTSSRVVVAAYSPDGTQLLAAHADNTVRLWSATQPQASQLLAQSASPLTSMAYRPDGHGWAVGTADGRLWICPAPPDPTNCTVWTAPVAPVIAVTYSPDGTRVLTAQTVGVRLWDTQTGQPIATLPGPPEVRQSGYSPDGRELFTLGAEGTVRQYLADPLELVARLAPRLDRQLTEEERTRYSQAP